VLLRARLGASAVTEKTAVDVPAATAPALGARLPELPSTSPALVPTASCRATMSMSRFVVTTTILGKTRRAAIVNGRLYREGDKIAAGSECYRLAGVAEDRIELVSLAPNAGVKHSVILQPASQSDHNRSGSH
jgi:hypothetical protein